jgi:hypothetical protein
MNKMIVTTGDYQVFASGQVIQIGENPIKVTLPDDIEGDFSFTFRFKNDDTTTQALTNIKNIDLFHTEFEFVNFNRQLNIGPNSPVAVGTLRRIPLFFNYRVSDLPGSGKILLFNFYLKGGVQNVS